MNCVRRQEKCLRRFLLFVAAMVAVSLAGATSALAQCTDSWTGGGGNNNWSDGANWSTGKEPGSSDSVCIQKSGAAVNMDVSDGIADLAVGSSNSLTLPTVTNASPSLNINGSSLTNSGQIILSAPVSFGSTGLSLSSSGTVTLSDRGTITLHANSLGSDSIGGSGALLNRSTIQGVNSGQFNVPNVTGTATLGGTLNIKLLNKFVPLIGATFEILTARKVTGVFATVNGTVINGSEHFTVTYNSDNVTLTVVS